jgi:hydroxymethylpyrimidine/phosphomethylpyrimidine kinase
MVATSGDVLLAEDAIAAVRDVLIPLADLVTPNLAEAARLLDVPVAATQDEMIAQARALVALGCKAVVVKGGHGTSAEAVDIFVTASGEVTALALPRIDTRNTHGTGCTFAAAIVSYLALGEPMGRAVAEAKRYVHAALVAGTRISVGSGNGPLDHIGARHVTRERDATPEDAAKPR